jgi:uncharacterized membrane protein YgcG
MQNSPPPGDQPAAPQRPREGSGEGAADQADDSSMATRAATVTLIVSLVFVVVLTGVLATVAVLMTRNPDAPLLSTVAVRRLQTPMHLAPVTAVRQAPCPGAEAVLDDAGANCYEVAPGVTVTTVQKIETLRDKDGTYAVRMVLSPDSRDRITALTRDTVQKQIAIVVGDRVVTAPRVAQAVTEDSLSIAGFTKDAADSLVARLIGSPAAPEPLPTGPSPSCLPGGACPSSFTARPSPSASPPTTPSTTPATGTTGGAAANPTATGSTGTGSTGTGSTGTGSTGTGSTGTGGAGVPTRAVSAGPAVTAAARAGQDPRYASCKQAHANGYGPYFKGRHPEYYWYIDKDHDGVACDPQDL